VSSPPLSFPFFLFLPFFFSLSPERTHTPSSCACPPPDGPSFNANYTFSSVTPKGRSFFASFPLLSIELLPNTCPLHSPQPRLFGHLFFDGRAFILPPVAFLFPFSSSDPTDFFAFPVSGEPGLIIFSSGENTFHPLVAPAFFFERGSRFPRDPLLCRPLLSSF